VIYLDTSAVLKLVVQEDESDDLEVWLGQRTVEPRVTSALTRVELLRACRRLDPALLPAATGLLAGLDTIPLREWVLEAAAALPDPVLRSLDALHLASAVLMGAALDFLVAYDGRLLDAAARMGIPTAAPGARS
jgi:predicted nucleic acid-binding protein